MVNALGKGVYNVKGAPKRIPLTAKKKKRRKPKNIAEAFARAYG